MPGNYPRASLYRALFAIIIPMFGALPDALCASQAGASAQSPTASSQTQDPRLQRIITVRAAGITLADLLRRLSDDGLVLSANPACEEQKLQLRLTRKPVGELMQSLAQLLSGSWAPSDGGRGYRFSMNSATMTRRNRWWDLFLSAREAAKRAQSRVILQGMQSPPISVRAYNLDGTENHTQEAEDLRHQEFYHHLPEALQERIASNIDESAYQAGDGVASGEGAATIPLTDLPEASRSYLLHEVATFCNRNHVAPEDLVVRFDNNGHSVSASLLVTGSESVTVLGTGVTVEVALGLEAGVLPLNHQQLVRSVKLMKDNASVALKELAAYQESRVWPNDSADLPQNMAGWPESSRRADVLDWLADQDKIDYVADYYAQRFCRPMTRLEKTASCNIEWTIASLDAFLGSTRASIVSVGNPASIDRRSICLVSADLAGVAGESGSKRILRLAGSAPTAESRVSGSLPRTLKYLRRMLYARHLIALVRP